MKPKLYSFPHDTKRLADRFDLTGMCISIGFGILVAASFMILAFSNWFKPTIENEPTYTIILSILLVVLYVGVGLVFGFFAVILVALGTYGVLGSNQFFFKQKLGQQVQENFTNFIEWMRFNFNVDVSNLAVGTSKDKGAVWLVERNGAGVFNFEDSNGNSFSMSLVEGEENEYLVSSVEEDKEEKPEDTTEIEHEGINKNSTFIQFFEAYGDSLEPDTQRVFTKVIAMVNALNESVLDAETSETVRLAKAELDTLSLLMLRTVPFGIDEDVEQEFLVGVKVLNETLTSVYDAYKKELKNKLSSRVKEVEFFFQQ